MQTANNSQRIAVTGATGRVGSHLVEILAQRGHDVVQIARSEGVDVVRCLTPSMTSPPASNRLRHHEHLPSYRLPIVHRSQRC